MARLVRLLQSNDLLMLTWRKPRVHTVSCDARTPDLIGLVATFEEETGSAEIGGFG